MFEISQKEYEFLSDNLPSGFDFKHLKNDLIWQKAFAFYNVHNRPPLHMGCRPCYYKVLMFVKHRLKV
jgi:hypothetical protein